MFLAHSLLGLYGALFFAFLSELFSFFVLISASLAELGLGLRFIRLLLERIATPSAGQHRSDDEAHESEEHEKRAARWHFEARSLAVFSIATCMFPISFDGNQSHCLCT